MVWVDNFLVAFGSREEAEVGVKWVQGQLEELGFVISEKSMLNPSQRLEFLGLEVDTVEGKLFVGREKRERVREELAWLRGRKTCTARELARVVGRVRACVMGWKWWKLVGRIGRVLRVRRPVWMWDRKVVVSEEERWWAARIREDIGKAEGRWFVKVREEGEIYTDASGGVGWCVVTRKGGETREMRGVWREEQREWHINRKEL